MRQFLMKAFVDDSLCISCGLCISICPDVFEWDENGLSVVKVESVPKDLEADVRDAADQCPTEAITVTE